MCSPSSECGCESDDCKHGKGSSKQQPHRIWPVTEGYILDEPCRFQLRPCTDYSRMWGRLFIRCRCNRKGSRLQTGNWRTEKGEYGLLYWKPAGSTQGSRIRGADRKQISDIGCIFICGRHSPQRQRSRCDKSDNRFKSVRNISTEQKHQWSSERGHQRKVGKR